MVKGHMGLAMLATSHRLLCEFGMVVGACADNDQLNVRVCEEFIRRAVVLCFRVVYGAMLAGLHACLIRRCFCTLQECVDLQVRVGENEGQVEAFGGEAIAHEANFDGGHIEEKLD